MKVNINSIQKKHLNWVSTNLISPHIPLLVLFRASVFGTLPSKEYVEMEYKEIKHFIV